MPSLKQIAVCAISAWLSANAYSQTVPPIVFSPAAPSSADTITMRIDRGVPIPYVADSYRVSQLNNRLKVTLGAVGPFPLLPPIRPPFLPGAQFTFVEIGKLPAGTYSVDVVAPVANNPNNQQEVVVATDIPLVVSDARTLKSVPYVRLNYADHWWNPAESGWGLFIWQDKLDHVLGAWFTYGTDKRAEWYTIQMGSWVAYNRYEGQLIRSTGTPAGAFVPGSAVQAQVVGSAILNFTDADNGTFTYSLNGLTQTKVITRFNP